ncbi:ATP-binding protein [Nocardioides solisilvae]|uniref:sensor histidine kinase n=1 Tax=Nocardioides solisilvae TaxID=1542435 RepID=UPI000D74EE1C|nr:ATP-binding protein [Nocardioides solisilvae]
MATERVGTEDGETRVELEQGTRSHDSSLARLYELMRRVHSSADTAQVLDEIARGVTEGLGYGIAAISRLEGEELVTTTFAGPEHERPFIIGRRRPVRLILEEFVVGDEWGILRYVPRGRVSEEALEGMWIPDYEPQDVPDAWHPEDALYAPLYSATGELLGIMAVDLPPEGRIPDRQQRELLEMFVIQAGLALSNAQHRGRMAERLALGEMLKQVALAGNLGDLDMVVQQAARAVTHGLGVSQTFLRCFPESPGGTGEHAAGHPAPNRLSAGIPSLRHDMSRLLESGDEVSVGLHVDQDGCPSLPESCGALQRRMREHGATRATVSPMRVGADLLGYVVVMQTADQTALTRAQRDALAEVGRALGQMVLNARLRSTEQLLVAELQELDRYKGELIATISHELKTPLTSIVGHTELLADGGAPARSLAAIARNAQRLQGLIDNLLSYSRVQEQRSAARRDVDLVALVDEVADALAIQVARGELGWEVRRPAGPVTVLGDPEELRRVVENICGNAVKYSRPGGGVAVEVGQAGRTAFVAVTDQGLGISRQDQAHLFSPFHRSSNPDALSVPGTGLGLAISRRIVELHDGTIEVDSELGVGSTFTVRLPLRPPSGSARD